MSSWPSTGGRCGSLYIPSRMEDATSQHLLVKSGDSSQLCDSDRLSTIYDTNIRLFIVGLLESVRPNYILRRVRAVVVKALQCVIRTGAETTDVFIECGETFRPSVTYGNSPTTISIEPRVIRLFTSSAHPAPDSVDERRGHPMRASSQGRCFGEEATTTSNCPVSEMVTLNAFGSTAGATANPSPLSRPRLVPAKNGESSKHLSSEVMSAHFFSNCIRLDGSDAGLKGSLLCRA